jgi:hypothetical protein
MCCPDSRVSDRARLAATLRHLERVGLTRLDGGDSQRDVHVDPELQQLVDEAAGTRVLESTAAPDPKLVAVADLSELHGQRQLRDPATGAEARPSRRIVMHHLDDDHPPGLIATHLSSHDGRAPVAGNGEGPGVIHAANPIRWR